MPEPTINSRFREIRADNRLSQTDFGKPVGMTLGEVKNVEYNITNLREDKIPLICGHYHVSEQWLRTGQGAKYAEKSIGEEIGITAVHAAHASLEDAQQFFKNMYEELGEANFLLLYEMFRHTFPQYDKPPKKEGKNDAETGR